MLKILFYIIKEKYFSLKPNIKVKIIHISVLTHIFAICEQKTIIYFNRMRCIYIRMVSTICRVPLCQ